MRRLQLAGIALVSIVTLTHCDGTRTRSVPIVLTAAQRNANAQVAGAVIAQSAHYQLLAATKAAGGNPSSTAVQLHDRVLSVPGEK